MAVASFTVLLIGFILGGSTVYLVENHLRTNEMNKIYKLHKILYLIFDYPHKHYTFKYFEV